MSTIPNSTTHTPTPWEATLEAYSSQITTADGTYEAIAEVIDEMDAVHIIRCVNLWDEIITELEWMSEQWDDSQTASVLANRLYDTRCTALKLLAKAKGAP